MGTTNSKPTQAIVLHGYPHFPSPQKTTNWLTNPSETPVRFSNALVHTLTSTDETSLSREQALELHVQARVSEELQRLEEREGEVLRGVEERMEKKTGDGGNSGGDREKVRREIEGLRARLVGLHGIGEVTEEVHRAREGLVGCLRTK
jgi:altered-inheritance-of-mitochondria protein 13